jgi:hypothetical protein
VPKTLAPHRRPRRRFRRLVLTGLVAIALYAAPLRAADDPGSSESADALAKQTQNPVADLISVPFQNNFAFNAGPEERSIYLLNVQPVIPIRITENWNLITRIIVPILNVPELAPGLGSASGLGDINPTFFLSPAKSKKFIWGIGPTFTLPTASDSLLGSGKWSAGPAAVALLMEGPWVVGALVNNQWSFAGWSDEEVNQGLMQPFLNYNFSRGWYLTSAPIMTADWTTSDGWTVPVGGGGGKLWRVGRVGLPVNTQIQGFFNAIRPDLAPNWQLRFQVQLLFPK